LRPDFSEDGREGDGHAPDLFVGHSASDRH
jgi:hypothetical protein